MKTLLLVLGLSIVFGGPGACSSTGIALKESLGYPKREQLVDKVEAARDGQVAAKKQFESALAEFLAVTGLQGSAKTAELEARYDSLRRQYARSQAKAETVHERIESVDAVATALFKEWREELKQYSSESLRTSSEKQLEETRARYQQLLAVMRNAESKMAPVLAAFNDQVLFLKHNLNARAIASLRETSDAVQRDVSGLIKEMEASIAEANAFIEQMNAAKD